MEEKNNIKKFRVHHILCTLLYKGKGYDGDFCANMTRCTDELRLNPKTKLLLVSDADMICAHCPNFDGNDKCTQTRNSVKKKDEDILKCIGLEKNTVHTYSELISQAEKHVTKAVFDNSCKNCIWYKEGLCSYEEWLRAAKEIR